MTTKTRTKTCAGKGIFNSTRKQNVADKYRLCRSIHSKARGLMFTNESSVLDRALIFEFNHPSSQSLHMFFVFYPIDVLFLDEKKRVVDVKQDFRPFTIYNSSKMSKYVIELPRDTIIRSKTRIGDELRW